MDTMLQARLTNIESITLERVPVPELHDDQVLIEVRSCGICGSDVHSYKGKHPFVHPPIVLGHELSGIVRNIAVKSKSIQLGERVTVEPNIACGKCRNCLEGRYNICEELQVIGCVGHNGGFAGYVVAPAKKVIRIPEEMSFDEACLVEPTAVAIHAVRKSQQEVGSFVVVQGAGIIGLLVLQIASIAGARKIAATDILDSRLESAKALGAEIVVNTSRKSILSVLEETGERADLIYDCVSVQETILQDIKIARKGTRIIVVGVPETSVSVDLASVQDHELELVGTLMYTRNDFLTAVDYIKNKRIRLPKIRTYTLEEINEAFREAISGRQDGCKVIVHP
jgi:L-iditol 2-dehydrogenase